MLIFEFGDHTRIAVRASGTEPKIKYYLFAQRRPGEAKFSAAELAAIKQEVSEHLKRVWDWLRQDAVDASGPITCSTSRPGCGEFSMAREIILGGGEISLLKKIGLSGAQVYGKMLVDRADEMETAGVSRHAHWPDRSGLRSCRTR